MPSQLSYAIQDLGTFSKGQHRHAYVHMQMHTHTLPIYLCIGSVARNTDGSQEAWPAGGQWLKVVCALQEPGVELPGEGSHSMTAYLQALPHEK